MKQITSLYLKSCQDLPAELAEIVDEVNHYGFYAAALDEFLPEIKSREEQMYIVTLIASRLGLRVTFNDETNFCVLRSSKIVCFRFLVLSRFKS